MPESYVKFLFIGPPPARKESTFMVRSPIDLTEPVQGKRASLQKLLEAETRINEVIDGRLHISIETR